MCHSECPRFVSDSLLMFLALLLVVLLIGQSLAFVPLLWLLGRCCQPIRLRGLFLLR